MFNTLRNFAISLLAPKHRAQGIDGSHWWGVFNPTLARKPIDFIIVKATEGTGMIDSSLQKNYQGALSIPVRGMYHYQRANMSWLKQAEFFLKTTESHDIHILALDVEKTGNEVAFNDQANGDTFFGDMRRIIDYWRMKTHNKKTVALYTNPDIYYGYIIPALKRLYGADGAEWLRGVPLWIAVYNGQSVDGDPVTRHGTPPWTIWQYSSNGRKGDYGTQGDVDLNVYNGTVEEMQRRILGGEAPTVPPPPPAPIPPAEPETLPETWTGKVVSWVRMKVRRYPEVGSDTETGQYLYWNSRVSGRLWEGNSYVWMKLDDSVPNHAGRWVAVRRPAGDKFIRLDPQPQPQPPAPPPTPISGRRLPAGRKFARLKFDFQVRGVSRPTYNGNGAAILGLPQTIKVLFPVGMPMTEPWQLYWADLFSLERYGRLYKELNRAERDVIHNALLGATVGWRAVTNKHGHDNGYAEYWTGQNEGKPPMQQETITFGGAVVELVTGQKEMRGGKEVYQVYTLDGEGKPPDAREINQFTAPWAVCYGTISRREKILDAQKRWTGKWNEQVVIHWPQLPTGVPLPFMGKGRTNYIEAKWIELLPDHAVVPKPIYP